MFGQMLRRFQANHAVLMALSAALVLMWSAESQAYTERNSYNLITCTSNSGRTVLSALRQFVDNREVVVVNFIIDGLPQVWGSGGHDVTFMVLHDYTYIEIIVRDPQGYPELTFTYNEGAGGLIESGYSDPRRGTSLGWNAENKRNVRMNCLQYFGN